MDSARSTPRKRNTRSRIYLGALCFLVLTLGNTQAQVYEKILSFSDANSATINSGGFSPLGRLIRGRDGNFYGTTAGGGANNFGTVFRMTPSGVTTTLVSFFNSGTASNRGNAPNAGLVQGYDGNFYGTTYSGGAHGSGTIFKMTPSGTITTLVDFTGTSSFNGVTNLGANPYAALTLGTDGNFYGTTVDGGNAGTSGNGFGTVFKMTPTGVLTTLIAFGGTNVDPTAPNRGANPYGGILQGIDGNLYGTTNTAGANGNGTIFEIAPDGTVTTLVDFTGTTGAYRGAKPYSGLIQGPDYNLYGTTFQGGTTNLGTIFQLNYGGTNFTTIVDFTGAAGANKGQNPYSDLVVGEDGNLWGSTFAGGTFNGGTLYRLNFSGTPFSGSMLSGGMTTMFNFSLGTAPITGGNPRAALTLGNDGYLYGLLTANSTSNHYGEVFKISYNGIYSLITAFSVNGVGSVSTAPLAFGPDGNLYGTTTAGGANGNGTVFRVSLSGNLTTLVDFTGSSDVVNRGAVPQAGLVLGTDGNFYGTTSTGGVSNFGTVFQMTPSGILTTLAEFNGNTLTTRGSLPFSTLVQGNDGNFYGTTSTGGTGSNNLGTVFQITPAGVLTTLISFTGTAGANRGNSPQRGLFKDTDGTFYGTTSTGGTTNAGTIFKMTVSGTTATLTTLVDFAGVSTTAANRGSSPRCVLTPGGDGFFYGTTSGGGANSSGTIFKMTPSGTITTLLDFTGLVGPTYGSACYSGILPGQDGNFYGTTNLGGTGTSPGYGTVFQFSMSGLIAPFTSLYDFTVDQTNSHPQSSLIAGSDGNLYGTTGGAGGLTTGLIFRVIMPGVPSIYPNSTTPLGTTGMYVSFLANARGSTSTLSIDYGTDGINFPNSAFITSNLSGYSTTPLGASITGLTPGTTYYYRINASNSSGLTPIVVNTFSTLAPPTVTLSPATNIGINGAKLNALVNPINFNTSVSFQYGTDGINFPNQVPAAEGTLTGNSNSPVSANLTGLTAGTTYYYRVSATNDGGTTVSGADTFTTLTAPVVSVSAATRVTSQAAQFNATVNAEGASAAVTFEYGTDNTTFPSVVGGTPSPVTGNTPVAVTASVTGLSQGTTYYYRVRAISTGGTSVSSSVPFSLEILSGFARQFPNAPLSAQGVVLVNLIPSGLTTGWRFSGEQLWRNSGVPALGLVTGNYNIEFRPLPGYNQPPLEPISVTSGGAATVVNEEYYPAAGGGAVGGLSIVLQPSALAAGTVPAAMRAQWRFLGENDTQWKDSGTTVSNLSPGNYLVECKPVSGQTTPPPSSIAVASGPTTLVTLTYFVASPPVGAQPVILPFSTVTSSATPNLPYAFVGQIRSNVGSSTGFVVQDRVVATAGHVVFDDGSLQYVTGLQWLFQRSAGTYEPVPQIPQGAYVFDGYAAQRTLEHTPGVSSPASQNLDAAALYFLAPAGNGGYGGYLGSDAFTNEFLVSSRQKMLVGYPVDGISTSSQGQMFATPAVNATFTQVSGTDGSGNPYRVYSTSDLTSVGGNSGGPLCVQFDDGNYYPAAIYLGGSAQTVVRSIDSTLIDMFTRAEISGNGGANNTGGGIDQINTGISGGSASYASIQVFFSPPAVASSATWAIGTTFFHNGDSITGRRPGPYTLTVTPVAGYVMPAPATVTLTGSQLSTITVTYQPLVVPPQVVTFTSASTIPITTSSYSVNGAALSLVLSYAPTPGTVLTAIQITGGSAISGTFSNLPNGGTITATFNNINYTFLANYSGGSGHNLTLTLVSSGPSSTDTPLLPLWAWIVMVALFFIAGSRNLRSAGSNCAVKF